MTPTPDWNRVRTRSLLFGAVGFAVFIALSLLEPARLLSAYLVGYLLVLGIALGALPVLMVHHLAGGGWGYLLRRPLEAATRTLPLLALMAIPLWFGQGSLYDWSATGAEAAAKIGHKEPYLNLPFFVIRSVLYFAVWAFLAWRLNRDSAAQDLSDDPAYTRRLRNLSGPGLIFYSLTMTFAAFDWIMSIEPLWYSTVFGVVVMLGQILTALSFSTIVLARISGAEELDELAAPKYLNDVGNMILTFLMLWAYCHFAQYLIIWSGNIAEETAWYVHRIDGAWGIYTPVLAVLHFVMPFLLLLQRPWKRDISRLTQLAGWLLILRFFEQVWLVEPSFGRLTVFTLLRDAGAAVGAGGLFCAYFAWEIAKKPLLPRCDPLLPGVMERLIGQRVGDV